ncbi:hypothetical protein V6Z12_A11G317500 [Gossypium hirsutum]
MAPSQPTTDAFVPHRRFTTLRFLLHLRLQRDEEEPMADLRDLLDTCFTLGCLWSMRSFLFLELTFCVGSRSTGHLFHSRLLAVHVVPLPRAPWTSAN